MFSVKVENGVVTNRIRGTSPGWIETDVAQINWRYDGTEFLPPLWDRSFAPSPYHDYDRDTQVWVENTESKARDEQEAPYRDDADLSAVRDKFENATFDEVKQWAQDNPQKALLAALMLHKVR